MHWKSSTFLCPSILPGMKQAGFSSEFLIRLVLCQAWQDPTTRALAEKIETFRVPGTKHRVLLVSVAEWRRIYLWFQSCCPLKQLLTQIF